jgi:hypothetical protein
MLDGYGEFEVEQVTVPDGHVIAQVASAFELGFGNPGLPSPYEDGSPMAEAFRLGEGYRLRQRVPAPDAEHTPTRGFF